MRYTPIERGFLVADFDLLLQADFLLIQVSLARGV